jgi:excisionase family DNA binding protein
MSPMGYLTVKQVAKLLGVTPLTLRNWDKSGKLKAMRNPINNYRIYNAKEIEFFLRKIESNGKIFLG